MIKKVGSYMLSKLKKSDPDIEDIDDDFDFSQADDVCEKMQLLHGINAIG